MPLGFERLNERTQRPNANINFIKTVSEGPDKAIAEEFLSRIAAQCYPVMKKHYISVMALEEYPPNPEFLGRNFNAGEVIQLVLKDKAGRWLSMKFVQMVMMHELAHCKQMNHSRFFWDVRNEYAKQMEELWRQNYEGEGIWGRGRGLASGAFVNAQPPDNTQIPEHLCGGSYRRKGRKRKRGGAAAGAADGEKLSYAERQQKRIQRKLGKHGVSMKGEALGDDELTRGALERMNGGKRGQGKPRVANSKRGRELRANAALARFEALKQQKLPETTIKIEEDLDSETESEWEEDDISVSGRDAIIISDGKGHDLVKVCGDGEDDEEGTNKELDELKMLSACPSTKSNMTGGAKKPLALEDSETESEVEDDDLAAKSKPGSLKSGASAVYPRRKDAAHTRGKENVVQVDAETESEPEEPASRPLGRKKPGALSNRSAAPKDQFAVEAHHKDKSESGIEHDSSRGEETLPPTCTSQDEIPADQVELLRELDVSNAVSLPDETAPAVEPAAGITTPCSNCSLENEVDSPTCVACSNVLRPSLMPNHWRCKSDTCKGSKYINAGDSGRCGLCGAQKPKPSLNSTSDAATARGMGITRPEVLRWD